MNNERKEIIQLNGFTILMVMALIANFLIVGFVYRWHGWKLFVLQKEHYDAHTVLLQKEREVKEEVAKLEGVSTWNDTAYARIKERGVR